MENFIFVKRYGYCMILYCFVLLGKNLSKGNSPHKIIEFILF